MCPSNGRHVLGITGVKEGGRKEGGVWLRKERCVLGRRGVAQLPEADIQFAGKV